MSITPVQGEVAPFPATGRAHCEREASCAGGDQGARVDRPDRGPRHAPRLRPRAVLLARIGRHLDSRRPRHSLPRNVSAGRGPVEAHAGQRRRAAPADDYGADCALRLLLRAGHHRICRRRCHPPVAVAANRHAVRACHPGPDARPRLRLCQPGASEPAWRAGAAAVGGRERARRDRRHARSICCGRAPGNWRSFWC